MFRYSISHNNITRNILCGLIFTVCLFVLSCGKRNSTHNYDPTTDTTPPTVSSTSPSNGDTSVSTSTSISVTFSESMDTTLVTTNSSNTSCSGTFQVSSNSFSSCIQMNSSPSVSNSNKTFTATPSGNLSTSTTYKIRVTTGVKDSSGNTLSS